MNKIYYKRTTQTEERYSVEVENIKECAFSGTTDSYAHVNVAVITDAYDSMAKVITVAEADKGSAIIKVTEIQATDGKIATLLTKEFSKLDGILVITMKEFAQKLKTVLDNSFSYTERLTEDAVEAREKRIAEAKKKED